MEIYTFKKSLIISMNKVLGIKGEDRSEDKEKRLGEIYKDY